MATRTAIYCRVSTEGQEDNSSLDTQEAACRVYALERGYTVAEEHVYRDVYTGAALTRPRLTALIGAMQRGEIDVLVCYALDRLSRDQDNTSAIVLACKQAGVRVEYVTESFDESTAVGIFLRNVKAFTADMEREKILERTMRGRRKRVKDGKLLIARHNLYGYQLDESRSRYVVDPHTAPIVERIFRDYTERGLSLSQIARALNDGGIPGRKVTRKEGLPSKWDFTAVADVLKERRYTGEGLAFRTRNTHTKGKRRGYEGKLVLTAVPVPESEQVPLPEGTIPALIDAETFARAQEQLEHNKQRRTGRPPKEPSAVLLRGYVYCGHCGWRMGAFRRGGGHYDYRCSKFERSDGSCPHVWHRITAAKLDRDVWESIAETLSDERRVANALARSPFHGDAPAVDLDALAAEIEDAQARQRRLIAFVAEGGAGDYALVHEQLAALREQERQLTERHERATQERARWEQLRGNVYEAAYIARRVGDMLRGDKLTAEQRAAIADKLNLCVRVYADGRPTEIAATIKGGFSMTGQPEEIVLSTSRRGSDE